MKKAILASIATKGPIVGFRTIQHTIMVVILWSAGCRRKQCVKETNDEFLVNIPRLDCNWVKIQKIQNISLSNRTCKEYLSNKSHFFFLFGKSAWKFGNSFNSETRTAKQTFCITDICIKMSFNYKLNVCFLSCKLNCMLQSSKRNVSMFQLLNCRIESYKLISWYSNA